MLDLSRVTYCSVVARADATDNNKIENVLKIGHETSKGINFGRKVIYTAQKPDCETYDFDIELIEGINHNQYTGWISKNLKDLFSTDFFLNFHSDGMIQNPPAWTDDFYNYDYIGAIFMRGLVGNGGFSLRSKLFSEVMSQIDISQHRPQKNIADNEDVLWCCTYKHIFEMNKIKYAPLETASRFSTEHISTDQNYFKNSFGFHEIEALHNEPLRENRRSFLKDIFER